MKDYGEATTTTNTVLRGVVLEEVTPETVYFLKSPIKR